MATVAHTISSHYNPENDRRRLERETGQLDDDDHVPEEELWRKESAQIYPKRMAPPPRFVPAKIPYDLWEGNSHASTSTVKIDNISTGNSDSLFKSLPRMKSEAATARGYTVPSPSPTPATAPPKAERANKNNWFIMNAIQSDCGPTPTPARPAPTLADILSREPPPLPTEAKHKPPVWMAIGPSNKGFSMLQRSGWNEGETLGPYAVRQKPVELTLPEFLHDNDVGLDESGPSSSLGTRKTQSSIKYTVEVKYEEYGDDISELKQVEIVDLTLTSDSESELDDDEATELSSVEWASPSQQPSASVVDADPSGHGGYALLTPIATVLKADRMGIGLKPKTIAGPAGAYRIPQKRITPNAAAMAAHIRAGEKLKKQKKDAGRGRRAFERERRKEASERKAMLAYLNA